MAGVKQKLHCVWQHRGRQPRAAVLAASAVVFLTVLSVYRFGQPVRHPSTMVPKLLHYVSETEMLPADFGPLMNSCIALNSAWTVLLWTDQDVRELLLTERPELLPLYLRSTQAERQVMSRYPVLYSMGGVFLDTSVQCLKPLDSALDAANSGAFLALDRPENHQILQNAPFKLTPAAMGSPPRGVWFGHALDVMRRRASAGDDLTFNENFPTDCQLLWQRRKRPPGESRHRPEPSVYLLPWEYFAPTLRDPDTMLILCRQLLQWPELADVYSVRRRGCSRLLSVSTGLVNSSAIAAGRRPLLGTVGVQHHDLTPNGPPSRMTSRIGWHSQLVFNASAAWPGRILRYSVVSGC